MCDSNLILFGQWKVINAKSGNFFVSNPPVFTPHFSNIKISYGEFFCLLCSVQINLHGRNSSNIYSVILCHRNQMKYAASLYRRSKWQPRLWRNQFLYTAPKVSPKILRSLILLPYLQSQGACWDSSSTLIKPLKRWRPHNLAVCAP